MDFDVIRFHWKICVSVQSVVDQRSDIIIRTSFCVTPLPYVIQSVDLKLSTPSRCGRDIALLIIDRQGEDKNKMCLHWVV